VTKLFSLTNFSGETKDDPDNSVRFFVLKKSVFQ
jgi:hypothetical protein